MHTDQLRQKFADEISCRHFLKWPDGSVDVSVIIADAKFRIKSRMAISTRAVMNVNNVNDNLPLPPIRRETFAQPAKNCL